jgi:ADP-ribose pyrophosphatase
VGYGEKTTVKPLKTEVAFATPWFEVVGKTMVADEAPYYSLRLPDYAAVVALTEDERVLVVRQYRPAVEQYTLELPSGIVDPGETPATTARRELVEETGYAAAGVEVVGSMTVDTGRLNNAIWACVATGARRVQGPEQGIEVEKWSVDELWRATRAGEFGLSLHVSVLMRAVLAGKLALQ